MVPPPNMFVPEGTAHPIGNPEAGMVCHVQCKLRQGWTFISLCQLVIGVLTGTGYNPGKAIPNLRTALSVDWQLPLLSTASAQGPRKAFQSPLTELPYFSLSTEKYTLAFCLQTLMSFSLCYQFLMSLWRKVSMNLFTFLCIWLSEQRALAPGMKVDQILTLKIETSKEIQ